MVAVVGVVDVETSGIVGAIALRLERGDFLVSRELFLQLTRYRVRESSRRRAPSVPFFLPPTMVEFSRRLTRRLRINSRCGKKLRTSRQ
jgi:hypothetical protein